MLACLALALASTEVRGTDAAAVCCVGWGLGAVGWLCDVSSGPRQYFGRRLPGQPGPIAVHAVSAPLVLPSPSGACRMSVVGLVL